MVFQKQKVLPLQDGNLNEWMTHSLRLISHCSQELTMRNRLLDWLRTRNTQVEKAKGENSTWHRSELWDFYLLGLLCHCTHGMIPYWAAGHAGETGLGSNGRSKYYTMYEDLKAVKSSWQNGRKASHILPPTNRQYSRETSPTRSILWSTCECKNYPDCETV